MGTEERVKLELCAVKLCRDAVILSCQRMNLAEYPQTFLAGVHDGTAPRMIGRVIGAGFKAYILRTGFAQQCLDSPLHGEKLHTSAVCAERQHALFPCKPAVAAGQINPAQFIQADGLIVIVIVARQDLQHGRKRCGAHNGGIFPQRIADPHRNPQGRIGRKTDLIIINRRNKRIGDNFAVARGAAYLPEPALKLLFRRVAAQCGLAAHQRSGDPVIAIKAGDFFRQIGHALDVTAPGGDSDLVSLHLELQLFQDPNHFRLRDIGAQEAVYFVRLQLQNPGLRYCVENVDDAVQYFSRAQQFHQLTGPVDCRERIHWIQALFKLG